MGYCLACGRFTGWRCKMCDRAVCVDHAAVCPDFCGLVYCSDHKPSISALHVSTRR